MPSGTGDRSFSYLRVGHRGRTLARDAEHPDLVLGLADDRLILGMLPGKGCEAQMRLYVVDKHDASRRHRRGSLLHLEQRVLRGVQAVVDEQLDMSDVQHQAR